MTWPVAALYVDAKGPYPGLVREWYDADRDARSYSGDIPVVAHPPCGPWGKLAWRCKHQRREDAIHAVEVVRRVGGVLEHPVGSRLFEEMGIPTAPWDAWRTLDAWGGYTIRTPQWHYGHAGMKDTILYIVGTTDVPIPLERQGGEPRPVQNMAKSKRHLTPGAFAWWLCNLASRCQS